MSINKTSPMYPTEYSTEHVAALQALERGEADARQQKLAIAWIINDACGTYDNSYRNGGEDGRRDTDFALGKRFVGLELVKMIKLNLLLMKDKANDGRKRK